MAQTSETTNRHLAPTVGRLCRQHAPNLFMASFFLPPRKRLAFQAAGGFLHMLNEALDLAPTSGGACAPGGDLEARAALVLQGLDVMYSGQICPPEIGASPQNAVIAATAAAIERYQIPKQWFLDLIAALKICATKLRYATWSSLQNHLRQTGGSSALILTAILGATRTDIHDRAVEMGTAIELTKLLRDLNKDARKNRILLPLEDLIRFKYSEKNLLVGVVNDNFTALMKFQIDRARDLFRSGADGIPAVGGDGSRLAASTLTVLYSGLLKTIERNHYDIFTREIKLTSTQRARRLIDAWRLARGAGARGWEKR